MSGFGTPAAAVPEDLHMTTEGAALVLIRDHQVRG
jgi:hypothetical protein